MRKISLSDLEVEIVASIRQWKDAIITEHGKGENNGKAQIREKTHS